jgi:hypothetical protein
MKHSDSLSGGPIVLGGVRGRLVDGLHPTLSDETAKDGAPGRFWRS